MMFPIRCFDAPYNKQMSSTLARWQIKESVQSKTAIEHLNTTEYEAGRSEVVLRALVEPWYEDGFSERVLQMYLNECRMGKGREWYQQTQQAFMAHCSSWEPTFESILRDRQTYGSRRQRSNTMGDWMALSHLQGRPLSMDLLFVTKERHPRDPRPAVITQVPMVSDNTYKYAFETLYLSCYTHDTRWDGWLQKMDLRMMTPALFDVVALRWPDSMPDLVRRTKGDADALLDQWDLILSDLFTAEHGNHLANEIVRILFEDKNPLSDIFKTILRRPERYRSSLMTACFSKALYDHVQRHPQDQSWLSQDHLCHIANEDPETVVPILRTALQFATKIINNGHGALEVFTRGADQLNSEARHRMLTAINATPQRYSFVFAKNIAEGTSWTASELKLFLSTTHAKAVLAEALVEKTANLFVCRCVDVMPELAVALEQADFTKEGTFEAVVMRCLTPDLAYVDALRLKDVAKSLDSGEHALSMYEAAMKPAPNTTSLERINLGQEWAPSI